MVNRGEDFLTLLIRGVRTVCCLTISSSLADVGYT